MKGRVNAGTLMSVGRRILGSVYATVVANGSRVQDSGVTGALEDARGERDEDE